MDGIKFKKEEKMKNIFYNVVCLISFFSFECNAKEYKTFDEKNKRHTTQEQKEKLFAHVGCNYSNTMVVDPKVDMVLAEDSDFYKDNKEALVLLSSKYKKNVENKDLAPMYLEFISPIVGYGIKAAKPIKKDDFIGVYAGTLRNLRWADSGFNEDVDYAWYYAIPNKQKEFMIVDGKYEGNELRFINHANNPNTKRIDVIVGDKFYICYIASKDIEKDEELTVSYGAGYWDSRGITPEKIS